MDAFSFATNRMVSDAVERCLERISEAVAKLGDLAPILIPNQPLGDIRALGNRLRHNYDEIGDDRLWKIVSDDLPALLRECEGALRKLGESGRI